MRLSGIYEDRDITPVGSKQYSSGTEKDVRGPRAGSLPGVKPPSGGDVSDVGSPKYTKSTAKVTRGPGGKSLKSSIS